jgi:hypothetical protein
MRPKIHPKVKHVIRHAHHSAYVVVTMACIEYVTGQAILVLKTIVIELGKVVLQ